MSFQKEDIKRGAGRKSSLFCPDCTRSAPIDEGWSLNCRGDRREIACPNCGTVLVSQPRFESDRRRPLLA